MEVAIKIRFRAAEFYLALIRWLTPTPTKVYNASVLAGIGAIAAGVDRAFGGGFALIAAGALVLALALFERVLLFRSRR